MRCSTQQPIDQSGHVFSIQKKKHLLIVYTKPRRDSSGSLEASIDYVVFAQQKPVGKEKKPPALPPKSDQESSYKSIGAVLWCAGDHSGVQTRWPASATPPDLNNYRIPLPQLSPSQTFVHLAGNSFQLSLICISNISLRGNRVQMLRMVVDCFILLQDVASWKMQRTFLV